MNSSWPRFFSATIVVTFYILGIVYTSGQVSDVPLLANASAVQWFLGAMVAFISIGIFGGLWMLLGKGERRKGVVLIGVIMVIVGSPYFIDGDMFRGDFELNSFVPLLLYNASTLSAIGIFYLIAFKPAQAEGA
ncbi:hypothetical protein JYU02_01375 [bacterium AH-315-P15]|nr:hypothetical protein [bacterium AH-315-P15]